MKTVVRYVLCILGGLAVFAAGFAVLTMLVMAFGVAAVRSDAYGHLVTAYVLLGLPAALTGGLWLARRGQKTRD